MHYSSAVLLLGFIFLASAEYDPHRFKDFLLQNRMQQCGTNANQPRLPKSYYTPDGYYDGIPADQRMPPGGGAKAAERVPACNNQMIEPAQLDAYTFETERFITSIGLNIYDGATWAMALAILGEQDTAREFQQGVILGGATCQFKDVRGDAPCKGVIVQGQCADPDQAGVCGFCYGESTTEAFTNAWTFRGISDYWSLEGTIDARCPELGHTWIWNDYKPVLGENSWSNLISPLQVSLVAFGSLQAIPADDLAFKIAIPFVQSLPAMVNPQVGGLYYSPKNTLADPTTDFGFNISVENNASLMAGLKALLHALQIKNIYTDMIPVINQLLTGIEGFIKAAYDPSLGYFRQGGTVVNGQFQWNKMFAVDCQTWVMSVIGPKKVDSWFGEKAAESIWNTTKKIGGYHYSWDGSVDGLGFSDNSDAQCFSGEWTAGAINMLRIFTAELGDPKYAKEGDYIRSQIESYLTESQTINGVNCKAVKYANKRYFIPFGWWANPLDCIASTTWAAMLDSKFNPFFLGGHYNSTSNYY